MRRLREELSNRSAPLPYGAASRWGRQCGRYSGCVLIIGDCCSLARLAGLRSPRFAECSYCDFSVERLSPYYVFKETRYRVV